MRALAYAEVRHPSTGPEYTAEFDRLDATTWYGILGQFCDANIYQTLAYDEVRYGEDKLSHFVLKRSGTIVSAGQLVLVRVPMLGAGVAYMRWGPLWRRYGSQPDIDVFRAALRALRDEYVTRRGLCLRIYPVAFDDRDRVLRDVLLAERFVPAPRENPQRTLILDISPDPAELRSNFAQKWRNCLHKAERSLAQVRVGQDDGMFAEFSEIYHEMVRRKGFEQQNDLREFRRIQQALPETWKMGIFLCDQGGRATSGAVCSASGDTGVYLFGGTSNDGMGSNGSYLIQWSVIQWLKSRGCRSYNLNGINPESNPGTYHFKAGVAGRSGRDVHYLGRFDSYQGSLRATGVFRLNRLLHSSMRLPRLLRRRQRP